MNTPLVLLHGWGFSSAIWQPLIRALHGRGVQQVFAIDLPGFGTAFHEPCGSLDELLEYIAGQLPQQSVLCGWSLGGMLAVQLAHRYPEKVAGIITLGSNLFFTQDGDWPGMPRVDYEQFCQRFAAQPEKTWRRFLQLQLKGDSESVVKMPALEMLADYSALDPVSAGKMLALLGVIDNRTLFPSLAIPGLHLLGDCDAITPSAIAGLLRNMNPLQPVQVLPGCGHALPVAYPAVLAEQLVTFLQQDRSAVVPKQRIATSFSRAAQTYDDAAHLQRSVGLALLATLPATLEGVVLDIGCGTGFVTGVLLEKTTAVMAIDLAPGMLLRARQQYPVSRCVQADMENLPLANASVRWMLSNLAIQWASDVSRCLAEWRRVLQPGGQLLFSTFLPGTLRELEQCWRSADEAVHVNDFVSEEAITAALHAAGFAGVETVRATHTLYYPQLRDMARELKAIGAHNMNAGQPAGLTGKHRWQQLQAAYDALRQPRGLPATYEVLYVAAS